MTALTIRDMDDGDVESVAALWERCGLTRSRNDPKSDITFARNSGNAEILVGLADGVIVASVMVGHDGHRGTVYYVCVDPGLQSHGYGREIMAAAENWLRDRGVWKLNLIVRAENTNVIDFYSTLGYEREERVNMAKWLDPARKPTT